ncbi:MAG: hypothetical protein WBG89_11130, partial [Ornithinimicrobium sp.]
MSLPAVTAITHRWEGTVAGYLGRSDVVHVARRCADLAELLGCAGAGVGKVAAVSVDLRGVDRSAIATLTDAGLRILGVFPPGDEAGERTLRRWGITAVIGADAAEEEVQNVLAMLVSEAVPPGTLVPRETRQDKDETATGRADLDAEIAAFLDGGGSVGSSPPRRADEQPPEPS